MHVIKIYTQIITAGVQVDHDEPVDSDDPAGHPRQPALPLLHAKHHP